MCCSDAFDTDLMKSTLSGILRRECVEIPTYDFKTHSQCEQPQVMSAADVVLLEGILVLYDPAVRALMNMKLFVDTDSDTRLSRRGKLTHPHPTHTHTTHTHTPCPHPHNTCTPHPHTPHHTTHTHTHTLSLQFSGILQSVGVILSKC